MIIRSTQSISTLSRVVVRKPKPKHAAFYIRFYNAVTALQEQDSEDHHDPPCSRQVKPVKPLKLELILPKPERPGAKIPSIADVDLAKSSELEVGLFTTARHLKTIDGIIARCKTDLQASYVAKAQRQSELHGSRKQNSSTTNNKTQDAVILKLQHDIAKLEGILLDRNLRVRPDNSISVAMPQLARRSKSSRVLDSKLQNLLRLPARGQLSELADCLATTKVAPTVKTFNIMISRLSRLRQNAAAWIIFRAMLHMNFEPDEFTLSSILNLSIVSGSYADFCSTLLAARAQRRRVKASKDGPRGRQRRSLVLLSTIIKGCIKFGRYRRAEIYYTLLWSEKAKPNLEIMTAMLQGYRETGDWNAGRRVFRRMLILKQWDRKAVVTLLAYCRACNQPVFEDKIRQVAAIKGVVAEPGGDLDTLPPDSKTKGLDVPNHFKHPTSGDVGALNSERLKERFKLRQSLKQKKPLFRNKREALGDWA